MDIFIKRLDDRCWLERTNIGVEKNDTYSTTFYSGPKSTLSTTDSSILSLSDKLTITPNGDIHIYGDFNIKSLSDDNDYKKITYSGNLKAKTVLNGVEATDENILTDTYMQNNFARCSLYMSSIASIYGTPVLINYDTVNYINGCSYSNGTITIQQKGYYRISLIQDVKNSSSYSNFYYMQLFINGSIDLNVPAYLGVGSHFPYSFNIVRFLNVGDTIELKIDTQDKYADIEPKPYGYFEISRIY